MLTCRRVVSSDTSDGARRVGADGGLRRENLDRYIPIQLVIASSVDRTRPTSAER